MQDQTPPETRRDTEGSDGRDPLPRHTTPTWEMELLISGATVFSLLQLPDLLDAAFYRLFPRFAELASTVILMPYTYLLGATYALIATFVLHLLSRAYWVALVGLHSVYPGGIRWSALRFGPAYQQTMRARFPSTELAVERADNRASRVFGFGIGFALTLLAAMLLIVAFSLLTMLVYAVLGNAIGWMSTFVIVFALTIAPFLAAITIDRYFGTRLRPDGTIARIVQRLIRAYLNLGFSGFTNYPVMLFSSRMGQHRSSAILTLGLVFVLGAVTMRIFARENVWALDGYIDLPTQRQGGVNTLDPLHYADQRAGIYTLRPVPFIQSDVIEGDYLRLFIPFSPSRDAALLAAHCPPPPAPADDVPANEHEAAITAALLACLPKVYRVDLDGRVLTDLRYDLASEPELQARGFLSMIDVRALDPGRHELTITKIPPPDEAADAERGNSGKRRDKTGPRRITFWR